VQRNVSLPVGIERGSAAHTFGFWKYFALSILRSKSDKFFEIIASLPDGIGYELFP